MTVVTLIFSLSLVYGLSSCQSLSQKVGDPCSPPGQVNVSCGEAKFINETVSELSVADGYGVNLCLKEKVYEVQTYSYSYHRQCRQVVHSSSRRRRHRSRSQSRHRCCVIVCKRDSAECTGGLVNTTREEIDCCDGFATDPSLAQSTAGEGTSPTASIKINGCPIRLQESVLHSLFELEAVKFFLELSLADPDLVDKLWPKEITNTNETFTVFSFSDEVYSHLEDVSLSSEVSQAVLGHVVCGTLYSSMLNKGDILSPVNGNVSLHVSTVKTGSSEQSIYINGARINQTDASQARNGIVHVMESFIPLSDMSIIEVLAAEPDRFSIFSSLLNETGMKRNLNVNDKSWTVLAPTNAAFEKLPEGALECLRREEHKSVLRLFVKVHTSCSVEYSSTLSQRRRLQTPTRFALVIMAANDTISLTWEKIRIDELDISARNGVIHVLSEPIIPRINFDSLCS